MRCHPSLTARRPAYPEGGKDDFPFCPLPQNMALYADVSGKQFPVTRGQDVGRYQVGMLGLSLGEEATRSRVWLEALRRPRQAGLGSLTTWAGSGFALCPPCWMHPPQVSWSLDHKSAHAGTYEVRFFDEESYSLLRKVRGTTLLPELWVLGASPSGAGWRGGCLLPAWPAWPCAVFLPPRRWLVFLPPLPTHAPPHCPLTPAPPSQAQRNNEDVSVIPPLFTVSVDHRVSGPERLAWPRAGREHGASLTFGGRRGLGAAAPAIFAPPHPSLP